MNLNIEKQIIVKNIKSLNLKDLIIFLIPFAVFMYFLHVYDPGILNGDAFNQLHQITTGQFTNWHPFFHTFIEKVCMDIFPSPLAVGIFQITVFSIMWMIICKYNRDSSAKLNKLFILQVILTLIISIIPINAIYAISLDKDTLFSYFLLFLCFLVQVMLNKKGKFGFLFALVFSATLACLSQIRPNGMILMVIFLVLLAVYLFKNNRNDKMHVIIPILTITFILIISSLNIAYDVENNQKDVILDKSSHMLSFYDLNVNVSDADREKIYNLISKKDINEKFDIDYTDPTYFNGVVNHTAFKADKLGYVNLVIKYTLKNPVAFMEYLFESSSIVWDITRDADWSGYVYWTDYGPARERFYGVYHPDYEPVNPSIDNASSKNIGTAEYNAVDAYSNAFVDNPVLDTLFNSPALYMYLAFILMGFMYFTSRSKDMFLVYIPNLINILTVMISIPIQSNRYLYPNLLVFYLLLIITIGKLLEKKFDASDANASIANKNMNVPQSNSQTAERDFYYIDGPAVSDYSQDEYDVLDKFYDEIISEGSSDANVQKEETIEEMEARIREKVLREYENESKLRKR